MGWFGAGPVLLLAVGSTLLVSVSGCSSELAAGANSGNEVPSQEQREVDTSWIWRGAAYSSLADGSPLAALARDLSLVALRRSAAAQELHAAEASRRAAAFERFPQIVPTANVPVATSNGATAETSLGLVVEQMIYDFGQTRARLDGANADIEAKRIEVWAERNSTVFKGLSAAVDAARFTRQLAIYHDLDSRLRDLGGRLEARAAGGVANKGEKLRYQSALQQVQSDIILKETELMAVQSRLARLLPPDRSAPLVSLAAARGMCRHGGDDMTAPSVASAIVLRDKAEADARLVRSQRFPRIVAQSGVSIQTSSKPVGSFGIQLDTDNMLGLGQGSTIAAYDANVEARRKGLEQVNENIATELRQRDLEYEGLVESEQQLIDLVTSKSETLALFEDQVEAGSLSLTDGINLYREDADVRMQLLDVHANMVINCLQAASVRGTLAAYEVDDE